MRKEGRHEGLIILVQRPCDCVCGTYASNSSTKYSSKENTVEIHRMQRQKQTNTCRAVHTRKCYFNTTTAVALLRITIFITSYHFLMKTRRVVSSASERRKNTKKYDTYLTIMTEPNTSNSRRRYSHDLRTHPSNKKWVIHLHVGSFLGNNIITINFPPRVSEVQLLSNTRYTPTIKYFAFSHPAV